MKTKANDKATSTRVADNLQEAGRMVGDHRTVCCVGVFDGVHLGHQRLIEAAIAEAQRRRCWSLVLTFRNHPLALLAPAYAPLLLTDVGEKVEQIARLNPTIIAAIPFERAIAGLEPDAFIEQVLAKQLRVISVWCGADFRFGRDGRGDLSLLNQVGRRLGLSAKTIEPFCLRGRVVSSTWIRSLIERGEVVQATECLGREYAVRGQVVRGHGRGRQLGYPTANVAPPPGIVLPGDGIYAVRVEAGGRLHGGMIHVGPAPTFHVTDRRLEVYLFDFSGDLIGEILRLHFVARLRDVKRFDSPDQLILQMKDDEKRSRSILKRTPISKRISDAQ